MVRKVIGAVAMVVVLMAGVVPPVSAFSDPEVVSNNSGWTWWTEPRANVLSDGSMIWAGITSTGARRVYRSTGGGVSGTAYVSLGYSARCTRCFSDDHNAPALSTEPGHPNLVFYTEHAGTMKQRSAPEGTIDFGAETYPPFPFETTYAQVLRRGSQVILLARSEQGLGWWYLRSPDDGATWGDAVQLYESGGNRGYILMREFESTPDLYHLAVYDHPTLLSDIGYRTVSFDELWNDSVPTFTLDQLENVYDAVRGDLQVRLLDVTDKDGVTYLAFARWNLSQVPQYYVTRRVGPTWVERKMASGGAMFDGVYPGGVTFDRRVGSKRLYFSVKSPDGLWRLRTLRFTPTSFSALSTLDVGSKPLVRPVSVGNGVAYQELIRYDDFYRWSMTIHRIAHVAP